MAETHPPSNSIIPVAVAGASGRMGRMLIETILSSPDCQLVGALDRPESPALGKDAGEFLGRPTGVLITDSLSEGLKSARCLIDFTQPEGTAHHLAHCVQEGIRMVIGTTGIGEEGKQAIRMAGKKIGIVFSPNMAIGVNVTMKLVEIAARYLHEGYDIDVLEMHHNRKVDAPSGTALGLGEAVARALGRDLKSDGVFVRHGHTGARKPHDIGFATLRGGDVVGDHTVFFAGSGERIEITHRASNRNGYATGSLRACRFLANKGAGVFDMQDVLGLKD
jgi:4-hydroxy-tetrahydrodipicolinate reductase